VNKDSIGFLFVIKNCVFSVGFFLVWSEVPNLVQSFSTGDDEWGFRSDVFRWIELWKINSFSGWWFQTFGLFSISYMGCHPNPIDELHHFSRWLKHVKTSNQFWLI